MRRTWSSLGLARLNIQCLLGLRSISTINPEQTSMVYLPIIQAPAHELDTLNTVVMRVLHLAESLQQEHSNSR